MAYLLPLPRFHLRERYTGNPADGMLIYTYEAGTSEPKVTYDAADGLSPNDNPVEASASGHAEIFLGTGLYKIVVKTSDGRVLYVMDDIKGIGEQESGGDFQSGSECWAVHSGATDAYEVDLTPVPSAYAAGQWVRIKLNAANTDAASLKLGILAAKTIYKRGTVDMETGDLSQFAVLNVVYDGTAWQMLDANDFLVRVSANDTTPGTLDDKMVAGDNLSFSDSGAGDEARTIQHDGQVEVSVDDTTPGELSGKVVGGTGITSSPSDGGNETLTLSRTNYGKARVSADETSPDYLDNQIVASSYLAKTASAGGDETLTLASYLGPPQIVLGIPSLETLTTNTEETLPFTEEIYNPLSAHIHPSLYWVTIPSGYTKAMVAYNIAMRDSDWIDAISWYRLKILCSSPSFAKYTQRAFDEKGGCLFPFFFTGMTGGATYLAFSVYHNKSSVTKCTKEGTFVAIWLRE